MLGIVSGKNLSKYAVTDDAGNISDDRTYVVAAIEIADGTPSPDTSEDSYGEDSFFVSPLMEGLNRGIYNIVSMGGGYFEMLENGVQYRITECDNVEKFADQQVYLCVNDGVFYSNDAYNYSEESGSGGICERFGKGMGESAEDEKDITEIASEETADWKQEDFEQNTERVKELEIAPDGEGDYEYEYEIGGTGLGAKGMLGEGQFADRDEGNMAKARTVTGGDAQTAYIETYTLKADGKMLLRVYRYGK